MSSVVEKHLLEAVNSAEKLELESANDPEDDPFRSRYAARKIWEEIEQELQPIVESASSSELQEPLRAALGGVHLALARNHFNCEERETANQLCQRAFKSLLGGEQTGEDPLQNMSSLSADCCHIYVDLLNYYGYLLETWSRHDEAKLRLHAAETVYAAYKVQVVVQCYRVQQMSDGDGGMGEPPLTWSALMRRLCGAVDDDCSPERLWADFESLHTLTVFFLAQVYKNTEEKAVAARYCEKTLVRQLESGSYDVVDWAVNTATLSQYYLTRAIAGATANFATARHCLSAAESVIRNAMVEEEKRNQGEDAISDRYDSMLHCQADVYRCWCKYGIALLETSRDALTNANWGESSLGEVNAAVDQGLTSVDCTLGEIQPLFPSLNLDAYEKQVGCSLVTTFDDARQIFLKTQAWINKTNSYYNLDSWASDAVEVIQDNSKLYQILAAFEPQIDRKCKMHKRRFDMLSSVLEELNPQFFLLLCRQLIFEAAEICSEMLDLKVEAMEASGAQLPNEHQIQKVNMLAEQGIQYFQRFLDSFKKHDGEMPQKFSEDAVRPVVLCHFYMGRLWNKKMTAQPKDKLTNCAHTLEHYRWIVRYCEEADPGSVGLVNAEYETCSEMVTLLPLKMSRIQEFLIN